MSVGVRKIGVVRWRAFQLAMEGRRLRRDDAEGVATVERRLGGPRRPWDPVHDGIWMGGAAQRPGRGWAAVLTLSGSAARQAPPVSSAVDCRWPIADAAAPDGGLVRAWAWWAASTASDATPVLVRCSAGLNRSGLVVTRALMYRGFAAEEAIELVRERRHPWALFNDAFVQWLRREDAAPR